MILVEIRSNIQAQPMAVHYKVERNTDWLSQNYLTILIYTMVIFIYKIVFI